MSRHPTAEQPSAAADLPRAITDFSCVQNIAMQSQSACPTVLALILGTGANHADDAERLRRLMVVLATGAPVIPMLCGAFNRTVARRLAAPEQGETGVYLGAEPRCKPLPAKAVLQQMAAVPAFDRR